MAITVKHKFVSAIPDAGDPTIVQPSNWNDTHELTGLGTMAEQNANNVAITGGTISGVAVTGYVPTTETITAGNGLTGGGDLSANRTIALANTAVTTGTYGNAARTITQTVDQQGRLTNIFDQPIAIANTQVSGLGTASTKDAGVANGVATLDGSGTVPISQLPAAVLGALSYQGTWNASTNTPTLTSSVGTKGYYYVVNVAGTTNLNGITDWQIGDWAVYNGTAWQKIDNTDLVTSVNGYTGTVVLNATDVGAVSSVSGTAPVSVATGTTTPVISLASGYGDTQNPYASKTAKYVLAAPNANAGVPTFRQLANTDISGLGTMSTQNAFSVAITGGTINGVAIGGTTAGDGTFDILTANVSRLGTSTATSYVASNGLSSTSTFSGTPPTDGIVVDYSTGYGRFSAFTGDGYQWYTGGVGTTKIMDLSSTGALVTNGTVTANGVLLTGNTGTVTSVAATAGTGISVTGSPITTNGTLNITNTAPDQTVVMNSGTGISVTGTYPNFTVTNTAPSSGGTITSISGTTGRITSTGGTTPVIDLASGIAIAGTTGSSTLIPVVTIDTYGRVTGITTASNPQGTVTSVTGTAPVVSSGGATPAISMAAATGSVPGYLTAADWTTFNNKQPAGTYVNSVSATSPITSSGGVTPTIAIPAATGSVNGYLTSTDWTTFNSKAPAVTYTTNYVPYGQGTTTPALSANFTFNGTNITVGTAGVSSRIQGDFSNATVNNRTAFQTGTTNSATGVYALPNGTSTAASWQATNAADPTNASKILIATNASTDVQLVSGINGTGTYLPLTFWNNGAEKARLSVAGGFSVGTATDAGSTNVLAAGSVTGSTVRASNGIIVNSKTVSASYSIASGDSAMSVGPVTIATGQTVTIASGSRWVVL